jgi:hypothetical protein
MGSAYKNKGVQLLLDAVVRYLPDPDRGREHAVDLDKDEAKVVSRRTREAARHARVQARGRPLRPAHLHARLPGHARQGRRSSKRPHRQEAQGRPPRAHALRRDGGHRPSSPAPATSSRCSASTATRATPSPTAPQLRDDVDVRARAGHLARDQAEGQQGQTTCPRRSTAASPRRTRPSAWRRRGVERDDHRRHGRAAPRRLHRAHEARVQGRGRPAPPQVAYRETITQRPSSTTRTRSRPAARASTAASPATSSRCRGRATSSSSTRSSAARSRASSSRGARRASSRCSPRAA